MEEIDLAIKEFDP